MNYFELFSIPVSLLIDKNTVTRKYFELQKQFHPDFFGNAGEDEQAEALEQSSAVNKAFKVFTNTDETIKYVLQLKGLLEEEEKYALPPDFLMEMMELNEELMDAEADTTKEKIAVIEGELYNEVKPVVEHYIDGITTDKQLLQVKEYYYKKKYLQRILDRLEG